MPYLSGGFAASNARADGRFRAVVVPRDRLPVGVDAVYARELPADPERASMSSLEDIKSLVRHGRAHPLVRSTAARILRQAGISVGRPGGTGTAAPAILAIHEWVKRKVRYVRDEVLAREVLGPRFAAEGAEVLTWAPGLIRQIEAGTAKEDCDGMTILEASLLATPEAGSIPVELVIIKGDQAAPHLWSHILLQAHDGARWVSLDPIMKRELAGWHPPRFFDRRAVPVGGGPGWVPPRVRPDGLGRYGSFGDHATPREMLRGASGLFSRGFGQQLDPGQQQQYQIARMSRPELTPAAWLQEQAEAPGLAQTQALTAIAEIERWQARMDGWMLDLIGVIERIAPKIEPLGEQAKGAAHRLKLKINRMETVNVAAGVAATAAEFVPYVGWVLAVAIEAGNAAWQLRQASQMMKGSSSKTIQKVGRDLYEYATAIQMAAEAIEEFEKFYREFVAAKIALGGEERWAPEQAALMIAPALPSWALPVAAAAGLALLAVIS